MIQEYCVVLSIAYLNQESLCSHYLVVCHLKTIPINFIFVVTFKMSAPWDMVRWAIQDLWSIYKKIYKIQISYIMIRITRLSYCLYMNI